MKMLHGSMRHYPNGRKKDYNAWGTTNSRAKLAGRSFKEYVPPAVYRSRGTDHIPSRFGDSHDCGRIDNIQYTGTLVKGISTMHKSNAVPIINEQEAKDIARMRR